MDLQMSEILSVNPLLSSMDSIQEVIDQGTINSKDHMGSTLLHRAAREGHVEIVEKLLESGASIYLEDLYGHLPLHVASMSGHAKIVQLLLNQDCDALDKMSSTKLTPLHCAAKEGKLEVVKLAFVRERSFPECSEQLRTHSTDVGGERGPHRRRQTSSGCRGRSLCERQVHPLCLPPCHQ